MLSPTTPMTRTADLQSVPPPAPSGTRPCTRSRAARVPGSFRRRALLALPAALSAFAILVTCPGSAEALRGVRNNPKIGVLTSAVGVMSDAQIDTLSWYDQVSFMERQETLDRLRELNPDMIFYYWWDPQTIQYWDDDETFWHPDTTWNLLRLVQFYCKENDWYLYTTNGDRIEQWDAWFANWTRYCPKGTYGTSRGLNYVEWLSEVAIPQIVGGNNGYWSRWGEGGRAYNGFMIEVLVDCVGSWFNQAFYEADPDRDGVAEGCYDSCTMGGNQDSLSILMREMNGVFHEVIDHMQDRGVEVILTPGNKYMGPAWRTNATGIKLEGYMSWYSQNWQDWWDWFYGLQNQQENDSWGPGYKWAEIFVGHTGVDSLEGWDRTLVEIWPRPGTSLPERQRLKRIGLGTTLLGEGTFAYTEDQHGLFWQPEYEWDFGPAEGPYFKETYPQNGLVDTLYVRRFANGQVKVNPHDREVGGVAPRDATFEFWGQSGVDPALPSGPRVDRKSTRLNSSHS